MVVESNKLSRMQHLFYMLGKLESSGDGNHRLATNGLCTLTRSLPTVVGPAPAFAGAEQWLFYASLIKFRKVSLRFTLTNTAIAQASTCDAAAMAPRSFHVINFSVMQWATLNY
ncbi:hypothetical protein E2562_010728 [Oryza meyeriana var. granulata]|uniref:Uncharacterized protein n=1 Tax=Oryza meyeriana var. granulata TaxID=110450 RepID=A0A6G1EW51_9ORYZ|nr:hypothetical protein E2562_010728 [Oryza meyeriana var. granulata]